MVNIGFLGVPCSGKTSLLRNFVKFMDKEKIKQLNLKDHYKLIDVDFSGEITINTSNTENFSATVEDIGGNKNGNEKNTKTIHPNKVVFQHIESNHKHTIFDPGGDRSKPVVRMGIITISRIANNIIAVITIDQPLKKQFEFFNSIRYFPKEIFVCFNKIDLLNDYYKDIKFENDHIKKFEIETIKYFLRRRVSIKEFFYTCSEEFLNYEEYSKRAANMLINIAKNPLNIYKKSKGSSTQKSHENFATFETNMEELDNNEYAPHKELNFAF
ncbi:MAG: GTPase domain-containing protein [Promethearchaeota archaeon]